MTMRQSTYRNEQFENIKCLKASYQASDNPIALNILKKDKSKGSLKQKRYKAALDDTFLLKLLEQV